AEHDAAPHERALQKALAKDITIRVHGVSEYEKSVAASSILFGKSSVEELSNIDAETLEGAFDDDRKFHFEKSLLNGELNVLDLLAVHTTVRASKGEAKREISGNAISIKKEKITDPALNITSDFLLHDKYFFIQKGKEFYLIICN
ncbi:MAG: tyrosine--tRNA ligase, partial [Bacteroidia bacterium]|nr:tyrosine--tRNA ligase [Bacteroidia bacterium]